MDVVTIPKSAMKTEDEVAGNESSMVNGSVASSIGDVEEVPKKDLGLPYAEVKVVDVEDLKSASEASIDPWDIVDGVNDGVKWKERTLLMKTWIVIWAVIRIFMIVGFLYFFICSLFKAPSSCLQCVIHFDRGCAIHCACAYGCRSCGQQCLCQQRSYQQSCLCSDDRCPRDRSYSEFFNIDIDRRIYGRVGTVDGPTGNPHHHGANIGTTVTNTLVALTQSTDKNVFRRAFAGATEVHYLRNHKRCAGSKTQITAQLATHYLYHLTKAMTANISPPNNVDNPKFLTVITSPLTELIVMIDKKVITAIAHQSDKEKFPLAKYYCKEVTQDYAVNITAEEAELEYQKVNDRMFSYDVTLTTYDTVINMSLLTYTEVLDANSTQCSYLSHGTGMPGCLPDPVAGGILLIGSLLVITFSLLLMVNVLNSLIKGPMARIIRQAVNAEFPGCFKHLTGYLALLVGCGITVIFQSSSVFTSTLTPLVGMGVITVERVYPLPLV